MAAPTADAPRFARLFGHAHLPPPPPPPWPVSDALLRRVDPRRVALGSLDAAVLCEVDEKTEHWPGPRQQALVDVVVAIADAEVHRQAWDPKRMRRHYRAVVTSALHASRLARILVDQFPATHPQVHALAGDLLDFVRAAIDVNLTAYAFTTVFAARHLRAFYAHERRPPVSKRLIADLVTVALGRPLGRSGALSESDLRRRYLERGSAQTATRRDVRGTPATPLWRQHWTEVVRTLTRARAAGVPRSPLTEGHFARELRAFLGEA